MKRIWALLTLLTCGMICAAEAETDYDTGIFTPEVIQRALVSVGNTERIQAAIAKAKRGEKVTLAYLGGSITEGGLANPEKTMCYAYRSAQIFAEKFCQNKEQLNYVNAGVAGTPSLLGITRCEQDVLRHQPDVVFVEFAVNDSSDTQSRMAYESLVRKLLQSEARPAVVLIFMINSSGYSAQTHMEYVGKHYDLGMISIGNAITPEIKAGRMAYTDYSPDYTHPHNAGHAFVADLLGHYFNQAEATPASPYEMRQKAFYSSDLENLTNIRDGSEWIADLGDFTYGAASCYSYKTGWRYGTKGENRPLTLRVDGQYMTIAFKQEKAKDCGKAEVYVDGKLVCYLQGSSEKAWGNVVTQLVRLGDAGLHTVEIRMAQEDVNKRFTVLDMTVAP